MAKRIRDNGEPGLINLYNMQKYGRFGKEHPDEATLVNPCVTSDTWIMTKDGSYQVKDLIERPFVAVVNGKEYNCATGFFHTGNKAVYKLHTKEGFSIKATKDHQILTSDTNWVKLQDLIAGDTLVINKHDISTIDKTNKDFALGWLLGSLYGDGTFHYKDPQPTTAYLCYWGDTRNEMVDVALRYMNDIDCNRKNPDSRGTEYGEKITISNNELARIASKYISRGKYLTDEIEKESLIFQSGFLSGWFDADGTVIGTREKGFSIRLSCSTHESLSRAQRMLLRLGIYSTIYKNRRPEQDRYLPDNKGYGNMKLYHCQAQHELCISRASMMTFYTEVGFNDQTKILKLENIFDGYKRKPYGSKFTGRISLLRKVRGRRCL